MPSLTPPGSDVVTGRIPYVAMIELPADHTARPLTVSVRLHREEPGIEGAAVLATGTLDNGPDGGDGRRKTEVRLDVSGLAEGEYRGDLSLASGDLQRSWPIALFRMPERGEWTIPFGIYAVPFPPGTREQDALLGVLRDTGIDLICNHMSGVEDSAALDRAARLGIRFRPSDNLRWRDCPDELRSRLSEDDPEKPQAACKNQPAVRKEAAERLLRGLREYRQHAGFSGSIYYGDDLFLPMKFQQGKAWLSCYCEGCRRDFESRFGYAPPVTTEQRLGTIDPADPWLEWMRYRCEANYGGFVRALAAAGAATDPDIAIGLCHGWPDNPFSSVVTGLYAPLTQPTDVVSSYCYPFLRSAAADFICHYEIAKMGNRDKDVWMLGLFAADLTVAPPWQVRQNYWNMLAAGYKSIAFFSWWDYVKITEGGDAVQKARLEESLAALARCGEHKDWVLPSAAHWEDLDAPYAALYSFTTEACDIAPVNRGNVHSRRVCDLYRRALARQVPMKVICEEEVLAGALGRFETVCLHDVRVLRGDVKVAIAEYAAAGGTVLLDPDPLYADGWHPAVRVEIPGAIEMSPDTMVETLRDRTTPAMDVSNPDVTARQFVSGEIEYFVLVNNYPDRYRGMTYTYGNPNVNYERAALVRDEPVEATVRFRDGGRTLFDVASGRPVGNTDDPLQLSLEPSWGRVLASLPADGAALAVDGPVTARQGDTTRFALRVEAEGGAAIKGAFTVKVGVVTPSGRESRYSGFIAIADGAGEFVLPLGTNDETGQWALTFEGGFPRRTIERVVEVEAGAVEPPTLELRALR